MPRQPKNPYLRLIDGSHRNDRHGSAAAARAAVAKARVFGKLRRPDNLDSFALEAWNSYIVPAWWLDRSKEALAVAAVMLWQQFREDPPKFTAAMHGQLRAYWGALGLADERNRGVPPPEIDDPNYA
jgi:hypothetical protein